MANMFGLNFKQPKFSMAPMLRSPIKSKSIKKRKSPIKRKTMIKKRPMAKVISKPVKKKPICPYTGKPMIMRRRYLDRKRRPLMRRRYLVKKPVVKKKVKLVRRKPVVKKKVKLVRRKPIVKKKIVRRKPMVKKKMVRRKINRIVSNKKMKRGHIQKIFNKKARSIERQNKIRKKLKPYGDYDKDGVANWADCKPKNKRYQDDLEEMVEDDDESLVDEMVDEKAEATEEISDSIDTAKDVLENEEEEVIDDISKEEIDKQIEKSRAPKEEVEDKNYVDISEKKHGFLASARIKLAEKRKMREQEKGSKIKDTYNEGKALVKEVGKTRTGKVAKYIGGKTYGGVKYIAKKSWKGTKRVGEIINDKEARESYNRARARAIRKDMKANAPQLRRQAREELQMKAYKANIVKQEKARMARNKASRNLIPKFGKVSSRYVGKGKKRKLVNSRTSLRALAKKRVGKADLGSAMRGATIDSAIRPMARSSITGRL